MAAELVEFGGSLSCLNFKQMSIIFFILDPRGRRMYTCMAANAWSRLATEEEKRLSDFFHKKQTERLPFFRVNRNHKGKASIVNFWMFQRWSCQMVHRFVVFRTVQTHFRHNFTPSISQLKNFFHFLKCSWNTPEFSPILWKTERVRLHLFFGQVTLFRSSYVIMWMQKSIDRFWRFPILFWTP